MAKKNNYKKNTQDLNKSNASNAREDKLEVEGKVVAHGKGKKIIVFKYKAKKNYRRKQGHRQPYTKVEITSIKKPAAKKAAPKAEAEAKVEE